jgi:predicted nucleic acid-binding Zn ribbon protein
MKEERLTTCPKCKHKLNRLIGTGSGIIFKGSGFYATDYRKKSGQGKETQEKEITCPKKKEGCSGCG